MFVGYEIKANQGQAKPVTLEADIKLSQAVLDPAGKGNNKREPVCLMAEYNKKQFILAVLDPSQSWQCPLDLKFAAGSQVKFFVRGSGTVHLTGYEWDDLMDDNFEMPESSDEEELSEIEEAPTKKAKLSPKTNGVTKNSKKAAAKVPNAKGDQHDSNDSEESEPNLGDSDEEMDDSDDLGELDGDDSSLGDLDEDESSLGDLESDDEDDDDDDDDDDDEE